VDGGNFSLPQHWGADCWEPCHGAGLCPQFCGAENACCRFGSTQDPPECHGIVAWGDLRFHTCIAPISILYRVMATPSNNVLHWAEDCSLDCKGQSGFCDGFCGLGNACCRFGDVADSLECGGILEWGTKDVHTCVRPTSPAYMVAERPSEGSVLNWGQDCSKGCGIQAGYCQEFCGVGNVCCRFGAPDDPAECLGITEWGTKDAYTCVAPAHPDYKVSPTGPPQVMSWGLDCLESCGGQTGYCQEFCGLGNACCLFTDQMSPPECHGIALWGAKDRHTCVEPMNPVYKVELDSPQAEHWGEDCLSDCKNRSGAPEAPECGGVARWGSKDRYTCVAPVSLVYQLVPAAPNGSSVLNWGADCFDSCDKLGGACPGFCGEGGACCRFGSLADPPECGGVLAWGSKEHHTCVAPVNPDVYVNHLAEDCRSSCKGTGFCEGWCGQGNACCRFGSAEDPPECHGVQYWPAHDRHTCVRARGPDPGVPNAATQFGCLPGEVRNADDVCEKADHPELMTFYMYRAATDDNGMELENANLANMEGVLWYLHNDVLNTCPRKNGISRILRFVVSVQNTMRSWAEGETSQFGQFVYFDEGRCMFNNSHCDELWKRYGRVVGCSKLRTDSPDLPNYAGPPEPVLFSLPGRERSDVGRCQSPDGSADCTWTAAYAGEIRIDELSGITDDKGFCEDGNVEYSPATDRGVGTSFWNEKRSLGGCMNRVSYARQLFRMKYPNFPGTLGEPACDRAVA